MHASAVVGCGPALRRPLASTSPPPRLPFACAASAGEDAALAEFVALRNSLTADGASFLDTARLADAVALRMGPRARLPAVYEALRATSRPVGAVGTCVRAVLASTTVLTLHDLEHELLKTRGLDGLKAFSDAGLGVLARHPAVVARFPNAPLSYPPLASDEVFAWLAADFGRTSAEERHGSAAFDVQASLRAFAQSKGAESPSALGVLVWADAMIVHFLSSALRFELRQRGRASGAAKEARLAALSQLTAPPLSKVDDVVAAAARLYEQLAVVVASRGGSGGKQAQQEQAAAADGGSAAVVASPPTWTKKGGWAVQPQQEQAPDGNAAAAAATLSLLLSGLPAIEANVAAWGCSPTEGLMALLVCALVAGLPARGPQRVLAARKAARLVKAAIALVAEERRPLAVGDEVVAVLGGSVYRVEPSEGASSSPAAAGRAGRAARVVELRDGGASVLCRYEGGDGASGTDTLLPREMVSVQRGVGGAPRLAFFPSHHVP